MTARLQTIGAPLIVVAAVLLVTLAGQFRPGIYTTSTTVGIYALLALPLGLIYGQGGTISLAQGAFAAVGGYTTAILGKYFSISPVLTIIPSVAVPACFAFLLARPILRLPELSLALVTLSLGTVMEVVLSRGGEITGGYVGLSGIPPLPVIGGNPLAVHLGIWVIVILLVGLYSRFMLTGRARALNAIRFDRMLAEAAGVDVPLTLALMFAISAGLAGLAGWYYAHVIGFIAPDSLSVALSANVLFMVVVGGRKTVLGPVLGAVIFTCASDVLPGTETQGMFFGTALIVILLLSPDGLLSLAQLRRPAGTAAPRLRPPLVHSASKEGEVR